MNFRTQLLALILCFAPFLAQNQQLLQPGNTPNPPYSVEEMQKRHFLYFWETAHPTNFQVPDRYPTDDFSSIAATGFGLSAYLVGAERKWITRQQAAERVLNTLRVLKNLPQGDAASGTSGYRGWFYHFLETQTAKRFKTVELSSIDTGLLMAGILSCMSYFDLDNAQEREIREMADFLFRRVEFDWYMNEHQRMSMGWFPERGFLCADWRGYNEAMVLVIMALGSPTHPLPAEGWAAWCDTYYRTTYQGQDMVNFGPLFGHQYSHCWIDFRGIQDDYMRNMGIDYFENSRRATLAQRAYGIQNPQKFVGYSENIWGLTAGDGPGADMMHNGKKMHCPGYGARGKSADYNEDDGTIAPTAAIASVPFAPEVCLPAAQAMWSRWPVGPYGFFDGYNETFTDVASSPKSQKGYGYWVDKDYLGIDQGPIVLMLENYRSGLIWDLMKKNPYIVRGLQRAGFKGGWLDKVDTKKLFKGIQFADGDQAKINYDIPLDQHSFTQRAAYADSKGNTLPYNLLVPWHQKLDGSQKYPLVVFLHGSGERGVSNHDHMKNGVHAFCEKDVREQHPCYLLVPQCPEEDTWGGHGSDWKPKFMENTPQTQRLLVELIEKMLRENPNIDPKRVYITGLSMGGYGTFDLLARRPDLFAAGMPLCGAGDTSTVARMKDIPIWVFHGRLDDAVFPIESQRMVKALQEVGGKVKYTEYSTLYHSIWDATYYNPAVLEWLFAQKKP
jgi:predicted esterase